MLPKRRENMQSCLLGILMELFVLRIGLGAAVQERISRYSGEDVFLPCQSWSLHTRWFWFPLASRCANISGVSVEIIWGPSRGEVTPARFNQRLMPQTAGRLHLKNLVVSDAGTYVCSLSTGSETHTFLEVKAGCHNNLLVSFRQLSRSTLQLSCHHCPSLGKSGSFHWTLNSQRLGNPQWATKNNSGSSIILQPIRSVVWGLWKCHSTTNPKRVSEICLMPDGEKHMPDGDATGEKHTGNFNSRRKGFDSAKPTSPAAWSAWWLNPAITRATAAAGQDVKGEEVWLWTLLAVGLALVAAGLGMAVWLRNRRWMARKCRGRKKKKEADLSSSEEHNSVGIPMRVLLQNNKEISRRNSLDEKYASLHYAQLLHPSRKPSTAWTPNSGTVYAVIV